MLLRSVYRLALMVAGIAVLLFCIGHFYFYYQEKPEHNLQLESAPTVQPQTRLLVFAPHCDDETLGCAGIIHDVIQAGGQVLVVIMTNGDGFTFATEEQFHRLFLTTTDYINSGYSRQQETIQALQLLGAQASQVLFLGYPDRGLNPIWSDYWDADKPFTSHYTGSYHSPYSNSYQLNAPYSGHVVFANLEKILREFQPTLILSPHPRDEHHDHSATWAFVVTAVAKLSNSGLLSWPRMYTYLIHRGDFPIPHGYRPELSLLPPRPLLNTSHWYTHTLNSATENLKEQSLKEYKSQTCVPVMSTLLHSFIRTNELFDEIEIPVVEQPSSNVNLFNLNAWFGREPILINPVGVNPLGALERKAKIESAYSFVKENAIWLRFHIPDFATRQNHYYVSLIQFILQENQSSRTRRAIYFSALDADLPPDDIARTQDDVIIRLPANQQVVPDLIFIQVTTINDLGILLDRTLWQPAFVRP